MPSTVLSQMRQAISDHLDKQAFATHSPQGLFAPIDYTLALGGKRLRPLLCTAGAYAFSANWKQALPAATALEVFHNFTLLHDDLMDASPLRRGQETVYRKWSPNTAILSGDAMSIAAYASLAQVQAPDLLGTLITRFSQVALEVCIGQQLDMEFETRTEVSLSEYLEMIRLKTSVLLGLSLELGARIGGASQEAALQLYRVGELLGLAFQIQDDLLDVYGDEATFGKPIGGDIIHAKKTLLLLYTCEQLTGEPQQALQTLLELTPEERASQVDAVRELYDLAGARAFAEAEIARLSHEAFAELEAMPLREEGRAVLLELFASLAGRTK